jgi:uncharacterized protein
MFRTRYFPPLVLLLLVFCGNALARPVPLMWAVEQGAGRVIMLGSAHLLLPGDYPLDASVEVAWAQADRVVFEVTAAEMRAPETAASLLRAGHFDDGRTLREVLPDDVRERLEAFMGAAAVAGSDSMKPWFIALNIGVSVMVGSGFSPAHGIDAHFMRRAEAEGKPMAGLETGADQVEAISSAPLSEQIHSLAEALQPLDQVRARLLHLHSAWRRGDETAIERLMLEDMVAKAPVSAKLLNSDRNQRWLPQIEAMLEEGGTTLVIVGALHLVGDVGLVELLRARGHDVSRIAPLSLPVGATGAP